MRDDQVTYPPLDVPKPVAENVWIVDSGPIRVLGLPLPVRMTVVRLGSGGLLLHSPTTFSFALKSALDEIGPIEHLIAPNTVHWMFVKEWQRHLPEVTTWGAPGLRARAPVQKAGVTIDRDLGVNAPEAWSPDIEQVIVPGAGGFCEVALFHKASRTLILTDLIQNLESDKLPMPQRLLLAAAGSTAPNGRAPAYLRAVVKLGGVPAKKAGARLIALAPDRVLFTHGRWFETDAAGRLKQSLAWLVR